jgi:hypothetical protein
MQLMPTTPQNQNSYPQRPFQGLHTSQEMPKMFSNPQPYLYNQVIPNQMNPYYPSEMFRQPSSIQ